MRSGFRALKKSVGLDIAVMIVGYADVCEFTEHPLDRGNTLCPDFDFGHICAMLHTRGSILFIRRPRVFTL